MSVVRSAMVAIFLLAVYVPAVDTWLMWLPRAKSTENRAPAKPPKLSLKRKQLRKLPRKVDKFYKENFGLRDHLINLNSRVKLHWLQQSPIDYVLIGQNNWLFFAAPADGRDGGPIQEFQGRRPLTQQALKERRASIEMRHDAYSKQGTRYLFVVAPNKQSIYPEHLPLHIGPRRPGNHLDAVAEQMRDSRATFIDVRNALLANKHHGPLYFYGDTHWNEFGAYFAYREIMKHLPGFKALEFSDLNVEDTPRVGGDLANIIGMADEWQDVNRHLSAKPGVAPPQDAKVILIGDSFLASLLPFFLMTFSNVRIIDVRSDFTMESVLQERPTIVVDERVERYLMQW